MRIVQRQRLWDQTGDLNYGGFLAHRNPKESEDEPASRRGLASCQGWQRCSGTVDKQGTQVGIAALGDAQQSRLAAGGILPWNQTKPSPQVPGFGKAAGIPYSCYQGLCI